MDLAVCVTAVGLGLGLGRGGMEGVRVVYGVVEEFVGRGVLVFPGVARVAITQGGRVTWRVCVCGVCVMCV